MDMEVLQVILSVKLLALLADFIGRVLTLLGGAYLFLLFG